MGGASSGGGGNVPGNGTLKAGCGGKSEVACGAGWLKGGSGVPEGACCACGMGCGGTWLAEPGGADGMTLLTTVKVSSFAPILIDWPLCKTNG
jgi:hypothetical protein